MLLATSFLAGTGGILVPGSGRKRQHKRAAEWFSLPILITVQARGVRAKETLG
jgi:hypothetical protein